MTSQGSPYARFRRAIDAGQALKAIGAAHELPKLSLEDALQLCLLLASSGDSRYEPAARRWLQRFVVENTPSLEQVVMAGAALSELSRRPASEVARDTLEQLVEPA